MSILRDAGTGFGDLYGINPPRAGHPYVPGPVVDAPIAGGDSGGGSGSGISNPSPPPPPGPPPPAGTVTIPGYTPDYQALIENDPIYKAWLASSSHSISDAASSRRAALRALIEQYGGLPSGITDPYGDIDPATLALASGNEQSDLARLDREAAQNQEAFKRSLAARGALQSGDLGYGMDQLAQQRAASEYDLGTQFANAFRNAIGGYLGAYNDAMSGQADAVANAKADLMTNPMNLPTADQSATLIPNWQDYGQPVWKTEDGTMYISDGKGGYSKYTPPSAGGSSSDPNAPSTSTSGGPPLGSNDIMDWLSYRLKMHGASEGAY